jgi:hypothetical protein
MYFLEIKGWFEESGPLQGLRDVGGSIAQLKKGVDPLCLSGYYIRIA